MIPEAFVREEVLNLENTMRKLRGTRTEQELTFGEKLSYMRFQEQYWKLMWVLTGEGKTDEYYLNYKENEFERGKRI